MKIQECVFDKEEIFEKAYKISIITEIFDILFDSYEFTPHDAEIVLEFKGNILEQVYDEWLKSDNGIREDVEQSIYKTFVLIGQVGARYAS